MARAALDHGVLWAGSAEEISRMVSFEGLENITQTKEPLIGASVQIEGTTIGTITDIDGSFVLPNVQVFRALSFLQGEVRRLMKRLFELLQGQQPMFQ